MSEIFIPDWVHSAVRITNARVYDLSESIAASKYPMQVKPDAKQTEITDRAVKLAQCPIGLGHDNWLVGVRAAFDISMTAKMLIEAERYHFFDIVSCNSTMHRIARFDFDSAYCDYVDSRVKAAMNELACEYNENPSLENYLRLLYSNPTGFVYTMRMTTNYRQLKTIYAQRRDHRLPEWRDFCRWIAALPESRLITGVTRKEDEV